MVERTLWQNAFVACLVANDADTFDMPLVVKKRIRVRGAQGKNQQIFFLA